jgi:hypothetical protein
VVALSGEVSRFRGEQLATRLGPPAVLRSRKGVQLGRNLQRLLERLGRCFYRRRPLVVAGAKPGKLDAERLGQDDLRVS